MKQLLLAALAVCLPIAALVAAFAPAPDADLKKVACTVHSGHFELAGSPLKGEASYLAVTDRGTFEQVFGRRGVPGAQPVPADAFETRMVAAVVKRGQRVWDYKVDKVTADKDTLYVHYRATSRNAVAGGGTQPAFRGTARAFPGGGATVKSVSTARADVPRGDGTTFSSALVVSVERGKYMSVVFIENGKRAGVAHPGN
jgi:hypothetical protein